MFDEHIEHLILFQIGVAPNDMLKSGNSQPYIIAIGPSKNEILSYNIEVEKHIIPVNKQISSREYD